MSFLAIQKSKWGRKTSISDLARSGGLSPPWKTQLHWLCPDSMKGEEEEEEGSVGMAPK